MADKISMEVAPGVKNLAPGDLIGDRDISNIQIGVEHGPSGTQYNRLAVPWAGAAYTLIDGSWVQVMGRDGAASGEEIETDYPNLAQVWREFANAQNNRPRGEGAANGNFDTLVAQLRRAGNQISGPGRMDPSEGTSLRAIKAQAGSDSVSFRRSGGGGNTPQLPPS